MSQAHFDATSYQQSLISFIRQADEATTVGMIAYEKTGDATLVSPERLPRLGFLYESKGMSAFRQWLKDKHETNLSEAREHFKNAFACWNSLFFFLREKTKSDIHDKWTNIIYSGMQNECLRPELGLAFRVAVTGLMGEKTA